MNPLTTDTTIPLKNISKLTSKTQELTKLLEKTDMLYKETINPVFNTLPLHSQTQIKKNFVDNIRKLEEFDYPINIEQLFSRYAEQAKIYPEFIPVSKLANDSLKAYKTANEFREYYLNYFKEHKIGIDFNYIVKHPKLNTNYFNMESHRYVLNLLVTERLKSMETIAGYKTSDFEYLDEITYENTAEDAIRYKFVERAVMQILKENASELVKENFYDLPIESVRIQGALSIARILSDASAEGVVWTVGSSADGSPPFATMKYALNNIYDSIAGDFLKDYNMVHELVIGFILNTIRNLTPNFMYVWAGFSCNAPKNLGPLPLIDTTDSVKKKHNFDTLCDSNASNNLEPIVLSEIVEVYKTFAGFFDEFSDTDAKISLIVLFQIFASLSIAQDKFRFVHGDLHANNVLVKKLDAPVTITYNLGGVNYSIETQFIPVIIDYGFARAEFAGKTLTMLRYMADFRSYHETDHMFQPDPAPDMFMPLYDAARLLQRRIHKDSPMNDVFNRGIVIQGGIGTLRDQFEFNKKKSKIISPAIFQTTTPHPMRVMSINLYDFIISH